MSNGFTGFAALGDSFTEGLADRLPDGGYRGWADLVAGRLAVKYPEIGYMNLAVRGRMFDAVIDEQVPVALRQQPDLISLAAGANDALRPGFNPVRMTTRLHEVVRLLRASGATVILFTFGDLGRMLPGGRVLSKRLSALNDAVWRVAARHEVIVVDLANDEGFYDRRMWSEDRLHLSTLGHYRVAAHVCAALEIEADPEWDSDLPEGDPRRWLSARRSDLVWARTHLAPWMKRRLTKRSSGDSIEPKRPMLTPLTDTDSKDEQ